MTESKALTIIGYLFFSKSFRENRQKTSKPISLDKLSELVLATWNDFTEDEKDKWNREAEGRNYYIRVRYQEEENKILTLPVIIKYTKEWKELNAEEKEDWSRIVEERTISKASIRRIARYAGVKRISGNIYSILRMLLRRNGIRFRQISPRFSGFPDMRNEYIVFAPKTGVAPEAEAVSICSKTNVNIIDLLRKANEIANVSKRVTLMVKDVELAHYMMYE